MIKGMANAPKWTPAGVKALAVAVKKRRKELGRNQADIGKVFGGPRNSTMTSIENAVNLYITWHTLRLLDESLDWPAGNAVRIVSGGEPLDPALTINVPLENMPQAELSDMVIGGLVELLRRRIQDAEDWPRSFLEGDSDTGGSENGDDAG